MKKNSNKDWMQLFEMPEVQTDLKVGMALLSEPFHPKFERMVVFITEINDDFVTGFAINKRTKLTLSEAFETKIHTNGEDIKIFRGGLFRGNLLQILHTNPEFNKGADDNTDEVLPGLFWGGSYTVIEDSINAGDYSPLEMKLLAGQMIWKKKKLMDAIKERIWTPSPITVE